MKKIQLNQHITSIALSLVLVYFYISYLPLPIPVQTGLDPSWAYAISRVSIDKLIFGKDVVITYGPLGYLIAGSSLPENFNFIFFLKHLVSFIFILLSIIKIFTLPSFWQKLLLFLSLIALFCSTFAVMITDHQLIVIFILVLSFENLFKHKKRILILAITLGMLSGFLLLTKLSAGISTLGMLSLFWIGNAYQAKQNHEPQITNYILAIPLSLLSALSISFILLSPNYYLLNFLKILGILTLSAIVATIVSRRLISPSFYNKLKNNNVDFKTLALTIFLLVYGLILLITLMTSFPSLIDYIKGGLEISSGYSSAMSSLGQQTIYLALAISQLVVVVFVLFWSSKTKNLGFALASMWFLWINFKHGFMREDWSHVFFFVAYPLLIVSLCLPKIINFNRRKITYIIYSYLLVVFLIFLATYPYLVVPKSGLINTFNLSTFTSPLKLSATQNRLSTTLNWQQHKEKIYNQTEQNLELVKLSQETRDMFNNKSVDVMPWELSLIAANNELTWKPRFTLQSYMNYTEYLDNITAQNLRQDPSDFIFYQFASIDGRHPFFDEPNTFKFTFCHYQPTSVLQSAYHGVFTLLEYQPSSRCTENSRPQTRQSINWNTTLSIPDNDSQTITIAKIKIKYSLLGKLYKTIFRAAPVMMDVTYEDGSKNQYRLLPENSNNGLIISNLPKNSQESLAFFKGELPAKVSQISFFAINPFIYRPQIQINMESLQISDFQEQPMALQNLKFKVKLPPDFDGATYLRLNPDLVEAGVDPKEHYLRYGIFEGRRYR